MYTHAHGLTCARDTFAHAEHQGWCGSDQVVDYIINAVRRSTGGTLDDEELDIRAAFSGWEWIVLNVCEVRMHAPQSAQHCAGTPALLALSTPGTTVAPALLHQAQTWAQTDMGSNSIAARRLPRQQHMAASTGAHCS